MAKKDISFVEKPSDDLFCPVTHSVMLQPHITVCCGEHISQEAATWIQGEGKRCRMCKKLHLKTVLDKRFCRQINKLRVFCHHKDRGCGWQGELFELKYHVQSCPMKNLPPAETPSVRLLHCVYSGNILQVLLPYTLRYNSDGDVTSWPGHRHLQIMLIFGPIILFIYSLL